MATCVLGLLGVTSQLGEFGAALMGTLVLGVPLACAIDWYLWLAPWSVHESLLAGILVPPAVLAAWFVPGFLEVYVVAAMLALTVGALTSVALARVPRPLAID